MPSLTRPAVRRLASVLAATALLTGGIVAGTGTAAAALPATDVCGPAGLPGCSPAPSGSVGVNIYNMLIGTLFDLHSHGS
ncbi:hypothetical protein [Rhodococcus sp. NPDC127528]|uniref:hypothetical protein n=1 Tax=unclassified Rhodococcus (in: high G+C Gram-positive bacteria) TaxID=192944 RepID=UPI003643B1C1